MFKTIAVINWIGPVADILPSDASFASRSLVSKGLITLGTSEEQKVQIMLWLAICGLLCTDRGSRVSTKYLKSLENLSKMSTFDWAELGYCSLLSCPRAVCR